LGAAEPGVFVGEDRGGAAPGAFATAERLADLPRPAHRRRRGVGRTHGFDQARVRVSMVFGVDRDRSGLGFAFDSVPVLGDVTRPAETHHVFTAEAGQFVEPFAV